MYLRKFVLSLEQNSLLIYAHRNQAEFASAVQESLEHLVGDGLLGSCALTLMYAFRNEGDVMRTGK